MYDFAGMALRLSIMYVYALVLLRLSGKRSIGELTALDFLIALVIGDLFDDAVWGEVPLSQALVAFSVLIILHTLVAYLTYRSLVIHELVSSKPALLIRNKRSVAENMARERIRKEELQMDLRMNDQEDMTEVREGNLEPNGALSILKYTEARIAQKKDKPLLEKLWR